MSMTLDYLAGFVDGEGGIYASVNRRRDRPTPQVTFHVAAYQVDRRPLEELQRRFGGSIGPRISQLSGRPMWRWTLTNRHGLTAFVKAMNGRLVIKAEQLSLLADWLSRPSRQCGNARLPDDEQQTRLALYERVRSLNSPHHPVSA